MGNGRGKQVVRNVSVKKKRGASRVTRTGDEQGALEGDVRGQHVLQVVAAGDGQVHGRGHLGRHRLGVVLQETYKTSL